MDAMKKLLCVLLSAIFLAGCGGQAIEPTPTPVITTSPTPEATPEATALPLVRENIVCRMWDEAAQEKPVPDVEIQAGEVHFWDRLLERKYADTANEGKYFRLLARVHGAEDQKEAADFWEEQGILQDGTWADGQIILATKEQIRALSGNEQYGFSLWLAGPRRMEGYSDALEDALTDWLEYGSGTLSVEVYLIYHNAEHDFALNGRRADKVDLSLLEPLAKDFDGVNQKLTQLADDFLQRHGLEAEERWVGFSPANAAGPKAHESLCMLKAKLTREQILALAEDPEVRCILAETE